MPRKDGREALKEIKADPNLRKIPIVVLTTSKAEEDILRTYDLGVSSLIAKPVVFDSMVQIMKMIGTYWFEIVELPSVEKKTFPTMGKGKKVTCDNNYTKDAVTTFDKSSAQISNLVYKTWFNRYPCCRYHDNGSEFNFPSVPYANHMAFRVSRPVSRTHKQMLYCSVFMLS